jgi:hypothetical protein
MIYSHTNILGLHLRTALKLRKLTRGEFLTRLQVIRTVEPIVEQAFKISEAKAVEERNDPRDKTWHLSFHASQFPGNNPMACPRAALYTMMDFPPPIPMSRKLRQTADSGLATEAGLVNAWHKSDMLLSSPDPTDQTHFELRDAWFTGSVDAVILPPGTQKPLPIEIKERKAEVIQQMQLGRGPFDEHISQIKVEIAFVRLYQENGLWLSVDDGYDLCDHGIIYYVSRDNPLDTAEFRVDYDEDFFVTGVEKLKRWRTYFEEDMLPEFKPGKRSSQFGHPHGWRWSYPPCNWCSFKKTCQLDFREGCTTLSDSNGVNRAKLMRPDYDAESSRLRVRARWQQKKQKEEPETQRS